MSRAKQLTVWVEDRPGMLGEVASALGVEKVNILAFTAGLAEGRGGLRMIVGQANRCQEGLRGTRLGD